MNSVKRLLARKKIRREAMVEVAIDRHIRHDKPRLRFSRRTFINLFMTGILAPGWTCYSSLAVGTGFSVSQAYEDWEMTARLKLRNRPW